MFESMQSTLAVATDVLLAQRPECDHGGGNNKMDGGVHFVCTGEGVDRAGYSR